jgi:hypothetical protein
LGKERRNPASLHPGEAALLLFFLIVFLFFFPLGEKEYEYE